MFPLKQMYFESNFKLTFMAENKRKNANIKILKQIENHIKGFSKIRERQHAIFI